MDVTINQAIPLSVETTRVTKNNCSTQRTIGDRRGDSFNQGNENKPLDSSCVEFDDESLISVDVRSNEILIERNNSDEIHLNDLIDSDSYLDSNTRICFTGDNDKTFLASDPALRGSSSIISGIQQGHHQIDNAQRGGVSPPQTECIVFDDECKRIDEEASILIEELVRRTIENEICLQKRIPNDKTTIPNDKTTIPNDKTMIPNDKTMIPNDKTTIPNDKTTIPNDTMANNEIRKDKQRQILFEIDIKNNAIPKNTATNNQQLSLNKTFPEDFRNQLSLNKTFPGDSENQFEGQNNNDLDAEMDFEYQNQEVEEEEKDEDEEGYVDDEPIQIGQIEIRRPSETSDSNNNHNSSGCLYSSHKTLPAFNASDVMAISMNTYYMKVATSNDINRKGQSNLTPTKQSIKQQTGLEDIMDESYLVSYAVSNEPLQQQQQQRGGRGSNSTVKNRTSNDQTANYTIRNVGDNYDNVGLEESLTEDFLNISTNEEGAVIKLSAVGAKLNTSDAKQNTTVQEDIFPEFYLDPTEAQMSISDEDEVFDASGELFDDDDSEANAILTRRRSFVVAPSPPSSTSEILVLFPPKRSRIRSETEINIPFKGEKKIRSLSASTFELLAHHYLTRGRFVSGLMSLDKIDGTENDEENINNNNNSNAKEWCYILRDFEQSRRKQWRYNVLVDRKPCQLSFQVIEDPTAIERWETSTFELMSTATASTKNISLLDDSDWVLINCSNQDIELFTAHQNEIIESLSYQQSTKLDAKREDELAGRSCAVS